MCGQVSYEWEGVCRSSNLDLDELRNAAALLEALVELGEVLLGSGVISAAQSQVICTYIYVHTLRSAICCAGCRYICACHMHYHMHALHSHTHALTVT